MKFEMLKCDKCGKKFEISAMSDCFQVNIESLHMADNSFSELNVAELCPECHKQFLNYIRSYCSRGRFALLDAPREDDKRCYECKHYPKNGITANAICLRCYDGSEYLSKKNVDEDEDACKDSEELVEVSKPSETLEAAKDEKSPIKRIIFHNITEEQAKNLELYSEDVGKITKENLEKQAKIWKVPEIKVEKSETSKKAEIMKEIKRLALSGEKKTYKQLGKQFNTHPNYIYLIKRDMKKKGEI